VVVVMVQAAVVVAVAAIVYVAAVRELFFCLGVRSVLKVWDL
jgi:hypothetical protein